GDKPVLLVVDYLQIIPTPAGVRLDGTKAAVDWNLTQGMRFLIAFILALPVALVLLYLKRSLNLILVLTALVAVLFGLFI
ncbi:hypothetical protein GX408_10710, partial [bacterium]|nr:hypothetical protein [bacterium]